MDTAYIKPPANPQAVACFNAYDQCEDLGVDISRITKELRFNDYTPDSPVLKEFAKLETQLDAVKKALQADLANFASERKI
jgi:hypothetical protein